MAGSTFPLRFRQERIRELVRLVAQREGISQNELLEQAAEHEVIAQGGSRPDPLRPRQITPHTDNSTEDGFGAVAAFGRAR